MSIQCHAPALVKTVLSKAGTTVLALLSLLMVGCMPSGSRQVEVTSTPVSSKLFHHADQVLKTSHKTQLAKDHPGEIVWLTAAEVRAVNPEGESIESDVFVGADLSWLLPQRHHLLSKFSDRSASNLFHFKEGKDKISLPLGFAIPLMSNEALRFSPILSNRQVRADFPEFRCSMLLTYSYNRGLETTPTPLFPKQIFLNKTVQPVDLSSILEKPKVLHFAVGYLPAGCHSLSLLDKTSNQTIFRFEQASEKLAQQMEFSSKEGLILDETHSYLLVSEVDEPRPHGPSPSVLFYFRDFRFLSR